MSLFFLPSGLAMSYILHKKIINSKMKLENQKRHRWYIGLRTSLSTPLPNPLSLSTPLPASHRRLSLSPIRVVLRKVAVCHSPSVRFVAPCSIPSSSSSSLSLSLDLISLSNSRDQQTLWVNRIINTSIY